MTHPLFDTLSDIRDRLLRFRPSVAMLDYWAAAQDRERPLASVAFDPIDIPALLAHVYLLERVGDRLRYRVSGEEVNRLFDSNHRGRFLDEVVPPDVYPIVAPYFLRVFDGTLCVFKGKVVLPNKEFLEFERVLLPVEHRGARHLLGCLALSNSCALRDDGVTVDECARGFAFTVVDIAGGRADATRIETVPVLGAG